MDHQSRRLGLTDMPIELSQAGVDLNLNQDLGGNLSVVSPRESHHTEETLPKVPLGQFQTPRSDNITTNSMLIFTLIHPPKVKYSLITITVVQ